MHRVKPFSEMFTTSKICFQLHCIKSFVRSKKSCAIDSPIIGNVGVFSLIFVKIAAAMKMRSNL